jgi:hypothetical protein
MDQVLKHDQVYVVDEQKKMKSHFKTFRFVFNVL